MNYIILSISFIIVNLVLAYILKRVAIYYRISRNFFDISLSVVLIIFLVTCTLEILYYSFLPIDFAFIVLVISFIFALYLIRSVFRVRVKKALSVFLSLAIFSIIPLYLIASFLIDIYRVPNNSMFPYLKPNKTYVLVNKVRYGLNKPFYNEIIINWDKPKQGDIVLFKSPLIIESSFFSKDNLFRIFNFLSFNLLDLPYNMSNTDMIFARILSRPGEYLPYKTSNKYNLENINKQALLYIPKKNDKIQAILSLDKQTVTFLSMGKFSFDININKCPESLRSYEKNSKSLLYFYRFLFPDNLKKILLSKGKYTFLVYNDYYFISADNNNSIYDSRYFGVIPDKNIVGKAFLKVIPIYEFSPILSRGANS